MGSGGRIRTCDLVLNRNPRYRCATPEYLNRPQLYQLRLVSASCGLPFALLLSTIYCMKKFLIAVSLATVVIVVGGIFLLSKNQSPTPPPTGYEYYWGDGCPHCKVVDDFLSGWEDRDKLVFEKFEVWNNQANAKRLTERFNTCQTPSLDRGVPLLVTPDGKCIGGDTPIIEKFKEIVATSSPEKK